VSVPAAPRLIHALHGRRLPPAVFLALSDERDTWTRRLDQAERRGWRRGKLAGFDDGYQQCLKDQAEQWRRITEPIVHPERGANRRLQAALSGERRDQADHERSFVARAYNTPSNRRTDPERGTVRMYPPAGAR